MRDENPSHEFREYLCALLFSNTYLAQCSKLGALETFYGTRRKWNIDALENVAIISGILHHIDLRPLLGRLRFPTVFVHGTEDAMVLPLHVECFINAQGPNAAAKSINDCICGMFADEPKHHVIWLRSGHEIIQERADFLHTLFAQILIIVASNANLSEEALFQHNAYINNESCVATSSSDNDGFGVTNSMCHLVPSDLDTSSDIVKSCELLRNPINPVTSSSIGTNGVLKKDAVETKIDVGSNTIDSSHKNKYDPGLTPLMLLDASLSDASLSHGHCFQDKAGTTSSALDSTKPLPQQRAAQVVILRQRRVDEIKSVRKREQEERDCAGARKLQMRQVHLRGKHEYTKQLIREEDERKLMGNEDICSAALRRMGREKLRWKDQCVVADARVQELRKTRTSKSDVGVEANERVKCAAKREARRRRLDDVRKLYLNMAADTDELAVTVFQHKEFAEVAPGAVRLRMDVLKIRQQKRSMVKRYHQVAEKANNICSQLATSTNKLRDASLALSGLERKTQGRGRLAREAKNEKMAVLQSVEQLAAQVNEFNAQDQTIRMELSAISSSIQRVKVVQNRKERELRCVLARLHSLSMEYKNRVLENRQKREDALIRRSELQTFRDVISSRHNLIISEEDRAEKWPSKFIDSSIWQSGVQQRIEKTELLTFLQRENKLLISTLRRADAELDRLSQVSLTTEAEIVNLGQQHAIITSQLELVERVVLSIDGSEESREKVVRPTSVGLVDARCFNGIDNFEQGCDNVADLVRSKPADERTSIEKEWVSYDRLLNLDLYKHVSALDKEAYEYDEAYKSNLHEENVRRISLLPEELNLAFPFLNSATEVSAHQLLQRITFRRGEQRLRELDQQPGLPHLQRYTDSLRFATSSGGSNLDEILVQGCGATAAATLVARDPLQLPRCIIVNKLEQVPAAMKSSSNVLVKMHSMLPLLILPNEKLGAREGRVHEFIVPEAPSIFLNIYSTIVFKGTFEMKGYVLGKISAALYWVDNTNNIVSVGYAPCAQCALCTPENFGKIVIVYQPGERALPVLSGKYHLVVGAASSTVSSVFATFRFFLFILCHEQEYSVTVKAEEACSIHTTIQTSIRNAHAKQQQHEMHVNELEQLSVSVRLANRKLTLVEEMIHDAESKCESLEVDMARLTRILELDENEEVTADELEVINKQIASLESDFSKWVKLVTSRRNEHANVKHGIDRLLDLKRTTSSEAEDISISLAEIRRVLPTVVALLHGDQSALNVSRDIGCKDSASLLRWSELGTDDDSTRIRLTPAEKTRRKFFKGVHLTVDEQNWIALDRVLNEALYEDSDFTKIEQAKTPNGIASVRSVILNNAAQQYSIDDLNRYIQVPAQELSREELSIRKLLLRFHDRRHVTGKRIETPGFKLRNVLMNMNHTDIKAIILSLTVDQRTWLACDVVLHPERMFGKVDLDILSSVAPETPGIHLVCDKVVSRTRFDGITDDVDATCRHKGTCHPTSNELSRCEILALFASEKQQQSEQLLSMQRILRTFVDNDELLCISLLASIGCVPKMSRVRHDVKGPEIITDTDRRCRIVLNELDRANASKKESLDSHVLHGTLQRFPVEVLRKELARELDRLLQSQVHEREIAAQAQISALRFQRVNGTDNNAEFDSDEELASSIGKNLRSEHSLESAPRQHSNLIETKKPVEVATDHCQACADVCNWTSPIDVESVLLRTREVQHELEAVKTTDSSVQFIESRVALSSMRGGNTRIARLDLLRELQLELAQLHRRYRLYLVDKELHDAYASKAEFIETTALHGYRQMQWTHNAIAALEQERTTILANEMATNLIDEILEWMLEGWLFGERKSDLPMLGYVPSIKPNGPLSCLEARMLKKNTTISCSNNDPSLSKSQPHLWANISYDATRRVKSDKAVKQVSELNHHLVETENSLQFGLFMLTLMYYRAMTMLKKASDAVSGNADLATLGNKVSKRARYPEQVAIGRRTERYFQRRQRLTQSFQRAEMGAMRKHARIRAEEKIAREKLRLKLLKIKRESTASLVLQRTFRGYLGRLAAAKWVMKRAELDAKRFLEYAAAAAVQRTYRGHRGRLVAEDKRLEMAELIARMRAQEAAEEEAEYWRKHTFRRLWRNINSAISKNEKKKDEVDASFDDDELDVF